MLCHVLLLYIDYISYLNSLSLKSQLYIKLRQNIGRAQEEIGRAQLNIGRA